MKIVVLTPVDMCGKPVNVSLYIMLINVSYFIKQMVTTFHLS